MPIKILLCLSFVLCCPSISFADTADRVKDLVRKHLTAIQDKDYNSIVTAWEALHRDPESLTYIRKNFKHAYRYLKLRKMAARLEIINEDFQPSLPITLPPGLRTEGRVGSNFGPKPSSSSNRNIARQFRNQNKGPNKSSNSTSASSFSNRKSALSSPNSLRTHSNSNQRRIRTRR